MTPFIPKHFLFFFNKTLFINILIIVFCLLFSACEDDPILDANSDEDCIGSYCLLVKPSDTNHSIEIEENPEEF